MLLFFIFFLLLGADGVPFAFLNGLEISSQTGIIYFTDSSSRWGRRHVKLEVSVQISKSSKTQTRLQKKTVPLLQNITPPKNNHVKER